MLELYDYEFNEEVIKLLRILSDFIKTKNVTKRLALVLSACMFLQSVPVTAEEMPVYPVYEEELENVLGIEEDTVLEPYSDDDSTGEVDDTAGLLPVYANTDPFDKGASSSSLTAIGYVSLDKSSRTAKYYYARCSSESPEDHVTVKVPRRLIVTTLNGEERVYDYSVGAHFLDGQGYALQHYNGNRIQVVVDTTVSGDEILEDLYIGEPYDVTGLDENVFKGTLLHRNDVRNIKIPKTISSDMDADMFSLLPYAINIEVYSQGEIDRTDAWGNELKDSEFRYKSRISQYNDYVGNEKINDEGVLVDTKPDQTLYPKAQALIVYCPPGYDQGVYHYCTGTNTNSRTAIAPRAFKNCTGLTTIKPRVPNTQVISVIGEEAFLGCSNLTDAYVFYNCLEKVEDNAFKDCKSLKEVKLEYTENTRLGKSVFANTIIEYLNIPRGYNFMTGESFKDMLCLREINVVPTAEGSVNKNFTSIDGVLYRYDKPGEEPDIEDGIELVVFPSVHVSHGAIPNPPTENTAASIEAKEGSFNVPYQTTGFDKLCFYKCDKLNNVFFPSTIGNIGAECFYGCSKLNSVYFYGGLWDWDIKKSEYSTTYIFEKCNNGIYVYAGDDTPAYEYAKVNTTANPQYRMKAMPLYNMECFTISHDPRTKTATVRGYTPNKNSSSDVVVPNYYEVGGIVYTVNAVASAAFDDPTITSVYFLHDMDQVSESAFYYRVNGSKNINDEGNSYAQRLAAIYIEEGNKYLTTHYGALYRLKYDVDKKDYVPSELLYYPSGNTNTSYTAIEGLESVPEYAFWGAKNLRIINIYDAIQEIGYNAKLYESDESTAFLGCSGLVKINILHQEGVDTANVKYFSDDGVLYRWDPFEGAQGTPTVLVYYPKGKRIMDSDELSHVSYSVYPGCREIKDMRDCEYLNSVVFPNSVTTIDDEAFSGSVALTSISFENEGAGNGLQTIGERAFEGTALISLSLPATVVSIGERAFYDCNSLQSVYIEGDSLISIGNDAFYRSPSARGTSSLKTIVITGTSDNFSGANLEIGENAFRESNALTSLTIKNMGNTVIGTDAFKGCEKLKTIDFSDTDVTDIGVRAFKECVSLESIDLSSCGKLDIIKDQCFYGCTGLESVKLPNKVTEIQRMAFKKCKGLNQINFDELDALSYIGEEAFAETGFILVVLPENLSQMGNSVFKGSELLSTIYVPETVTFGVIDDEGNFIIDENNGVGPFYDYGKDRYVYGVIGSQVDRYLELMSQKYDVPTFVGSAELPVAMVDLKQSEIDVFDVGDYSPELICVVSSQQELKNYEVIFKVMDESICSVSDISFDGIDTTTCVVKGLKKGTTRIYAINRQTGAYDFCIVNVKSASVEVNPSDKEEETITVDGLTVPKSIILNTKGTYKTVALNATSNPARKVYYKSLGRSIAGVNRKGIVTGKKAGTTTVIAYAGKGDTYVEAEVAVTVYKPTIKLDRKRITLCTKGDEDQTQAYIGVTHQGAYSDVTWESSNTQICTVEGNDDGAYITVNSSGKGGSAYVTAWCNGIPAKCKVIVIQSTVSLDTTALTLYAGTTRVEWAKLKAKTTGKEKTVTFISENPEIARVDSKGVVTAVGPGNTQIYATANGATMICHVRVIKSYVKIYGGSSGESLQEKASVVMNARGDNTYQFRERVVGRDTKFTWSSSAKNIFTVDKEGLVTGKSGGTAYLTLAANGETAQCQVTVLDNFVDLDYSDMVLYLEGSDDEKIFTMTATIEGADPKKSVSWEIEDGSILSISNASKTANYEQTTYGGQAMATFKAKAEGTTNIKVTANGISQYCRVTVKK